MNANDNEDERRRVITQLQEVVRRRHVASESGKDPEAEFALRAKRADAPARPAGLASGQGDSQKSDGRIPRPTPPLQGRDPKIKRFGAPGRGREMAADILAEERRWRRRLGLLDQIQCAIVAIASTSTRKSFRPLWPPPPMSDRVAIFWEQRRSPLFLDWRGSPQASLFKARRLA